MIECYIFTILQSLKNYPYFYILQIIINLEEFVNLFKNYMIRNIITVLYLPSSAKMTKFRKNLFFKLH